ncbi:MAG: SAM-dependent methyltransferase [Pseudomonadota bacterium]
MSALPPPTADGLAHSNRLRDAIQHEIALQGGWIPFSRFMELALYAPGLGYYTAGARKFGAAGDFTTAPEMSALFGRTVARQLAEIMAQSSRHILELGAGSGKLAADILTELEAQGQLPEQYSILEVSADLRERQQETIRNRLPHLIDRVQWLDMLPEQWSGALVANEVLDALPVHIIHWRERDIAERGVVSAGESFDWHAHPVDNAALLEAAQALKLPENYISEISLAARGLIRSLSERLQQGAMLWIDYGFGAREYYHPQRSQGTLMCHYRHHAHGDPFFLPGLQDLTAHVDFTAVAEAAIDGGAQLLGYTSQAHFLLNAGILDTLRASASPDDAAAFLPLSGQVQKLTSPAEMGELFKVIALGKGIDAPLSGFIRGDFSRLL